MAKIVTIAEVNEMIGHQVKAIGSCGIYDGVLVRGILKKLENNDVIVMLDHGSRRNVLPCSVNQNTLELVNGRCGNCNDIVSDAEAFNQTCLCCGKKL
jgi:hypothetical protein